jgi:hypothetical protein
MPFPPGLSIDTTTNLKGIVTHANDPFCRNERFLERRADREESFAAVHLLHAAVIRAAASLCSLPRGQRELSAFAAISSHL